MTAETTTTVDLFHVSRKGELAAGTVFNNQTSFEDKQLVNVVDMFTKDDVRAFLAETYSSGLSSHGVNYVLKKISPQKDASGIDYMPHMWALEFVFELVRQAQLPQCPSRFTSFFAWDSLPGAVEFRDRYWQNSSAPIYRVTAPSVFRADMRLLYLGSTVPSAIIFARKYWRGEPSANASWEYLLSAPVTIHEKVG